MVPSVGSVARSKVGSQHKAMKTIRPPAPSGRSRSGASLVPSSIVGRRRTSSLPLRPRVLQTFGCPCEAAAMIGPVARCAMGSCLTLVVCGMWSLRPTLPGSPAGAVPPICSRRPIHSGSPQ